jgi:AcrR family transcriptional regulator
MVTRVPARPRAQRLRAEDRRDLILAAARRAFSRNGDARATTIKQIAEEARISEGIIYRHFESKDELFVEAAVKPLTEALRLGIDNIRRLDVSLSGVDCHELAMAYYREMVQRLADLIPLLGLVLFGDPVHAVPFYRDVLTPALEDVRVTWNDAYRRMTGEDFPSEVGAMANFGIALMFALDQRLAPDPKPIPEVARELADMETRRIWSALELIAAPKHEKDHEKGSVDD